MPAERASTRVGEGRARGRGGGLLSGIQMGTVIRLVKQHKIDTERSDEADEKKQGPALRVHKAEDR